MKFSSEQSSACPLRTKAAAPACLAVSNAQLLQKSVLQTWPNRANGANAAKWIVLFSECGCPQFVAGARGTKRYLIQN